MIKKLVKKAVKAVTGAVSNVVGAVGDVVQAGVDVVAGAVKEVGKAVSRTARSVVKTVEKTVNEVGRAVESIGQMIQPLVERYAIQLALMYVGIPPNIAAPMSAGMHTIARGGSPEDAIKSAATVVVIDKVGASVATAAKDAGFTANEVAFAQSAAQSAVATAAYGGDINTVLQAAAIGGVSGVAGTSVLNETKNAKLAAFTESAVESALRGQKIDQAILDGASAATITYMREIKAEQDKADAAVKQRDAAYNDYVNQVNEYNALLERYNAATDQETVDNIAVQLDARLVRINQASENIGRMNQQLADMQTKVNDLTKKATAEVEKTGGDYAEKIITDLTEEENILVAKIQEAAQREFGDEEAIQLASYESPIISDVTQPIGEEPLRISITLDYGPGDIVGDPELNLVVDKDYNVVDRNTGEIISVIPENMRKRPFTGFIDLREFVGGDGKGRAVIGGGGTSEAGASILPFSFLGYDTATGLEKYSLFDEPFALITLDGNKRVLKSDIAPIFLELNITKDNQVEFKPVDVVETSPNKFETKPIEPDATKVPSTERRPGQPGGGGGEAYEEVIDRLTSAASRAALQAEEANALLQDALIKEQFFSQQAQRARQESGRLENLLKTAQDEVKNVITPDAAAKAQETINNIRNEINRVNDLTKNIDQQLANAQAGAQQADIAFKSAKKNETDATAEINRIRQGRAERAQKALLLRFDKELADYEKQLADLERKAQESTQGAQTTAQQARFGAGQVGRLRQAGRLTGQLQTDIEQEVANLIERSQQFQTAAREAATKKEGLVAPQQTTSTARAISDREIINLLNLSQGEQSEFGFREEEGGGAGTAPEGGAGTEGGAGGGADGGAGAEGGEGGGDVAAEDRVRPTTTVLGEPRVRTAGEQVSTLSPRVTGEALVGILGEKEPLFGGDEDEQRAVWNRRSLRLRRALGL